MDEQGCAVRAELDLLQGASGRLADRVDALDSLLDQVHRML